MNLINRSDLRLRLPSESFSEDSDIFFQFSVLMLLEPKGLDISCLRHECSFYFGFTYVESLKELSDFLLSTSVLLLPKGRSRGVLPPYHSRVKTLMSFLILLLRVLLRNDSERFAEP